MYEELMEEVVSDANAKVALKAVQRNKGKPGIDGMTTSQLEGHLQKHWPRIRAKLLGGTYAATPVREVEIPKPNGESRKLGIPTVLDRFIQQLLLQVLGPIWEPRFSDRSYGFRPRRSAHDAVRQVRDYAVSGKSWVVDIDIEKFFDRINHDILMRRDAEVIRDKRVLKLIGRYLRSGILAEGVVIERTAGTPQGSPLSPLLANIYLDPLDKELEQRGHAFARYADDCNVYVGGAAAADRLIETLPRWIEKHLRLKVNLSKSGVGRPWERKFLGFRITQDGQIEVSPQSLQRFKQHVRELWDARRSRTSRQLRDEWLRYLRGWWNYYRLAEWRRPILNLEGWIRRHMRKCFWLRWHCTKGRKKRLAKLGVRNPLLKCAASSRGAWRMARHAIMQKGLNNQTLRCYRLLVPSDLAQQAKA
ncbi:MAG: group II intron reverse transcriptase/maturase [Acidobacteriota bacterium]